MTYNLNADLPPSVRRHLPDDAQNTYRVAFNRAYARTAGEADREELAHIIGWAAVKRDYVRDKGEWFLRMTPPRPRTSGGWGGV